MATYRKRGKNWEYRIRYVDPITGLKAEKSKGGFRTKAEAEYAASEVFIDVKDGHGIGINKEISFIDFSNAWFEEYKPTVKETSVRSRYSYLMVIQETFQKLKLKNLTLSIYKKKMGELSQIYSKNTLISMNQICQMIAKKAVSDGYFKANPIANFKIPYYPDREEEITFWSLDTVKKFEEYCRRDIAKKRSKKFAHIPFEKQRDLAMFFLMLYGGLRIGEACALSPNDYFPITREIDISKTLASPKQNQVKSSWRIFPPKTKNAYRTVPLPEVAYKQIEMWLKMRKEYVLLFPEAKDSIYLFCQRDGSPLTTRDLRYHFDAIVKKADLPKITPHNLRHTYTALQIQAGIDPKSLQMLLGHASIKTTLNIYAHLTEDKKRENISRFDQMLKNSESGAKAGQGDKTTFLA